MIKSGLFVFAAVLACAGSFAKLAMLSAVARLTTYLFTCAALPFLRFRVSTLVLGMVGAAISLALFLTMNRFNFMAAGIAIVVGALIYLMAELGADVAPT